MGHKSKLILHICCGPCATYIYETLKSKFDIIGFYYNPNIHPEEEYNLRKNSLKKLANQVGFEVIFENYNQKDYFGKLSKEKDKIIPQPKRCPICYQLRLEKTAQKAEGLGFNYFSTTLLISPYQNLLKIKEIGDKLAKKHNIKFYFQDFTSGFNESKILSRNYDLYRQKYCGCVFSKLEREERIK